MNTALKLLNQKPVAYYPIYRQITGSTTAGILLSQLMYWFSKKNKFYKTDEEIRAETLLTEKELKTAKAKIKKLSFIKVTREGIPAKTYYEIDWEEYERVLNSFERDEKIKEKETNNKGQKVLNSLDERDKLNGTKGTNSKGQKGQTITKITTKITTKTTSNNKESKKENSLFCNLDVTEKNYKYLTQDILYMLKELNDNGQLIEDFINYRKEIKKPIKTNRPLKAYLRELIRAKKELGIETYKAVEIMQENEWQTIKKEWLERFIRNNKSKIEKKEEKLLNNAKKAIDDFVNDE